MKSKIIVLLIIMSVLFSVFSGCDNKKEFEVDIDNLTTFNFKEIEINYPSDWLYTNVNETKSVIENDNSKQGIILLYKAYDTEINETEIDNVLNSAYQSLKSSNNSMEISKKIVNTHLGKTINLEFSFNDSDLKSCMAKASIFVYGNAVYIVEYYEQDTEFINPDLLETLFNSITLKDHITVTTTTTEATAETTTIKKTEAETKFIPDTDHFADNENYVYIGKTGSKYHKKSCSTLKGSGSAVTLDEAIAQGRTACKRCKP